MSGSDPRHSSWERSIENSVFRDDVNGIIKVSNIPDLDKDRYHSFLQSLNSELIGKDETLRLALISRPSKWSTPSADLNITYKICIRIAQSVFSSIIPPPEILKKIETTGERLEKTATKLFYFLWFVGFMIIAFDFGRLLAFNVGAGIVLGLAIFLTEFFSLIMFPIRRFSRFKNVQNLCSTILLWKSLTFILPIFFIFLNVSFRVSLPSLFYSGLGFFVQWCQVSIYITNQERTK